MKRTRYYASDLTDRQLLPKRPRRGRKWHLAVDTLGLVLTVSSYSNSIDTDFSSGVLAEFGLIKLALYCIQR